MIVQEATCVGLCFGVPAGCGGDLCVDHNFSVPVGCGGDLFVWSLFQLTCWLWW